MSEFYIGPAIFAGIGSWCLYNLIQPMVAHNQGVNSNAWNLNIKQRESENQSARVKADVKRAMKVIAKAQNDGARWATLRLRNWDRLSDETLVELKKEFRVTVERSTEETYRRAQIFEKLCEWTETEEFITYRFEPKLK